ncbi:MGDG synthase family glycosyltransferase [Rugosimonospora africana]|uniref:Galactosyldiacylglycerol synthase n=1 Tax=Rugosimonospora africana TaxID=556532 RepID=A0A8J3QUF8_9ACTN|nr:glycosyltransferase [Rugosimonospora africana]GIH16292.1 galactosyldiacylglycerol synthase [Rugosimonospora africana]
MTATLLFLVADTGGGHRAAADAVAQALRHDYPGAFAPVLCDPLGGPGSAAVLRRLTGLYGPSIRLAPWAWGAVYHGCDFRASARILRSTLLTLADRPVADAVARHRPAAIVSFHPLTGSAAIRIRDVAAPRAPVVTIVTDLVSIHATWRDGDADRIVVPPSAAWVPGGRPGRARVDIGPPVAAAFAAGPPRPAERAALRRSLGLDEHRFLVLLTGGGEGSGGIASRATAILRHFDDVGVVVLSGRNRRLHDRLASLAGRWGGRLTVRGFVDNMADWLRCADVLAGKAGPGTIAEATCCGTPLLLTSHLPGQESGNIEFVVGAGAGRHVPTVRRLVREIGLLRRDPAAVDRMRTASARLGRPGAASEIAALLADLVGVPAPAVPTGLDRRGAEGTPSLTGLGRRAAAGASSLTGRNSGGIR